MKNTGRNRRNIIGAVIIILMVLVIWSMTNAISSNKNPMDDKHLGIAEYEKGNYREAVEHYKYFCRVGILLRHNFSDGGLFPTDF